MKFFFNTIIKDNINNNSITTKTMQINNSTLILDSSNNYKFSTKDSLKFMNNISCFSLKSHVKTHRSQEDSLSDSIAISLEKNILKS